MNERIKELAEQSGFVFPSFGDVYASGSIKCSLEDFAQLIVTNCCDMVNKHVQWNNPNDCLLVLDIKQHFGVE